MAGSVVISSNNVWTIGLHGFMPLIQRIRAAYPTALAGEDAAIFSSMDEGFDFIGVEGLSQERFMNFVRIAEQQLARFSGEHSIDENWRIALADGWRGLLDQLRQDSRYKSDACAEK